MASASIRVRLKQSIASSGLHTMGSFSLKLVFRMTGIPVLRSKALNQIVVQRIFFTGYGLQPSSVVDVIDSTKL